MSLEELRVLERVLEKESPYFEVRFKDESRLMHAIGLLVSPFNPTFLTHFTTTLGNVVYFPSRARYEANPGESLVTLAHEFVHIYDSREDGAHFYFSYAAPQVWALPLLVVYFIFGSLLPFCALLAGYVFLAVTCRRKKPFVFWTLLAVVAFIALVLSIATAGWWTLALLGAVARLGPWPSTGRTYWEVRGYMMNLAIHVWVRNALVPQDVLNAYVKYFTGPDYWFMCRDAAKVEALFAGLTRAALERKLQREKPYSIIHGFLVAQGRVSPAFSD